jgi:hypothetical protein
MFWILLTLKCLAIVSITGLAMAQLPGGRITDLIGTLAWAVPCVLIARHDLRKRG